MAHFDDSFFNTFAASTLKTLKDLCQVNVAPLAPFVKGQKDQVPFSIAGLIGLTSTVANGSIVLSFPKGVFLNLIEKMMGEKVAEITQEHEDAAAELLNIIFGQAKTILNKRGYSVAMAIPSVLRGGQVQASYSKMHTVKVLPFQTEAGEFYIEFLLNPIEAAKDGPELKQNTSMTQAQASAAFFKPFMDGTMKTMRVQCQLEVKPGKPYHRKSSSDYSFDIAGIIGITSKTVNGSFMLSFKKEVFLALISRMFGETITEFQPGLEDAVSELVNITLGTAKTALNAEGHGVQMAIPTIVQGETIFSAFQHRGDPNRKPPIVVPFNSEIGDFHVEITIE